MIPTGGSSADIATSYGLHETSPRPAPVDHFDLVESIYARDRGVVIAVSSAAD